AYDITLEEHQEIFRQQNGLCLICGKSMEGKHNCHVDHNHETGEIRGLLCHICNLGLGHFKDDFNNLHNAAMYVAFPGKDWRSILSTYLQSIQQ
ncbi:MAG: endonuclease VII domain-containing protein, partial [Thermoguttaceae bacterium]